MSHQNKLKFAIMKNDFVISLVWNKKGELKKDGTAPIYICVYADGKRKYFNSKICAAKSDWDLKKQTVKKTAPNANQKNKVLSDLKNKVENYCYKLTDNGEFVLDGVFDCIYNKTDNTDFYAFIENYLATDKIKSSGTLRLHFATLRRLKGFKNELKFKQVNYTFVEGFKNYLVCENLKNTSVIQYLKILRSWVLNAINKGLLKENPFEKFKIITPKTHREFLTESEFKIIENADFSGEKQSLQYVKDVFCFAVYSGLRISDILRLTPENIVEKDGETYIIITMQKVKRQIKLPINLLFAGKGLALLRKYYNGKEYFNRYTHAYINEILIEISKKLKIKHISIHTARHTFATILLNKNYPIVNLQKLLGHTDLKTTQIYAVLLDDTVNDNLKNIVW